MRAAMRASAPWGSPHDPNERMSAVTVPATEPVPRIGAGDLQSPSRLKSAFWLAALTETAVIMGGLWMAAHRPTAPAAAPAIEQLRLVQLPKPIPKPKPAVKPHPKLNPSRQIARPLPEPVPSPPVTLPHPEALPPSPIASPAPPPPPPQPVAPPVSAQATASYLGEVKGAIQQYVDGMPYPAQARLLRENGKVRVQFQLLDGVITAATIVTRAQLDSFNVDALSAVHNASIPSPPEGLAHRTLILQLWVKFHLHRSF